MQCNSYACCISLKIEQVRERKKQREKEREKLLKNTTKMVQTGHSI